MTRPGERGSAIAEFTMTSALVVVVVLALVQLTFALWVRTVLIDAAAEGARLAALAGGDELAAASRAAELVASTLGSGYQPSVSVHREDDALGVPGYDVMAVELSAPLPVLGLLGPPGALSVTGHAVVER
ncbi:TadE-like protein [Salana multivorans]|uniref:TadE-like protein n=1 Tax=Salana multivorans TaxID=120377 RepID=A0A3N2DCX7_9MICO|nr:TadE/TadG family type IV pilus assembly protein [Salana multivorans]ROR97572.1 TadE-like protein [Salana multivorans]